MDGCIPGCVNVVHGIVEDVFGLVSVESALCTVEAGPRDCNALGLGWNPCYRRLYAGKAQPTEICRVPLLGGRSPQVVNRVVLARIKAGRRDFDICRRAP